MSARSSGTQAGSALPSTGINWETIFFIAGMMVMVEGMAESGFFRWLCITIARAVHFRAVPVFLAFMVMSAVLSMFIDSITVILFLASVTVELAQLLHLDPVPMILCGDLLRKPGRLGHHVRRSAQHHHRHLSGLLLCRDFITNTGLMAAVSLLFVLLYFFFYFRKSLKDAPNIAELAAACPAPGDAIADRSCFFMSCSIFARRRGAAGHSRPDPPDGLLHRRVHRAYHPFDHAAGRHRRVAPAGGF